MKYKTGNNNQFRGCAFCQRMYDAKRCEEAVGITRIEDIISDIQLNMGKDSIEKTKKVIVLSGSPKSDLDYIAYLKNMHVNLKSHGFRGEFSVVTSLINSEKMIEELSYIDNSVFDFTLECFDRREELLGPEKGKSLEEVIKILRYAKMKFEMVRINYIVGLDSLESMGKNFQLLAEENLVDDVVANVLSTYSPQMKGIKNEEVNGPEYIYRAREILLDLGLKPRRTGVKKHLFLDEDFS